MPTKTKRVTLFVTPRHVGWLNPHAVYLSMPPRKRTCSKFLSTAMKYEAMTRGINSSRRKGTTHEACCEWVGDRGRHTQARRHLQYDSDDLAGAERIHNQSLKVVAAPGLAGGADGVQSLVTNERLYQQIVNTNDRWTSGSSGRPHWYDWVKKESTRISVPSEESNYSRVTPVS